MTDQDKIAAITNAIQTDANVMTLIRALITNNLQIVSSVQLDAMMHILGLV